MGKKRKRSESAARKPSPVEIAEERLEDSALGGLLPHVRIYHDTSYPMSRLDWGYVTGDGRLYLNPQRNADPKEWMYILAHCLLHLGLNHLQEERLTDPCWLTACDLTVTQFLDANPIGSPPAEFLRPLPVGMRGEERIYEYLRTLKDRSAFLGFGTMTGRPDMCWSGTERRLYWQPQKVNYPEIFAQSLQQAMEDSLRKACEGPMKNTTASRHRTIWEDARSWFLSSYPLLGAVAAAFRLIDDEPTVLRMHIPVAAVHSGLQEIYINPRYCGSLEEWKFILAHEFLHAALRHDLRCGERHPVLWNAACDFVINSWLAEMGTGFMPEGSLYETRFAGLSAEAVYDIIWEDLKRYTTGPDAPHDILYSSQEETDRLTGRELDDFYRSALQQGLAYHQECGRGLLPAGLIEEIHAMSRPPVRWDVELAKWFDAQFTLPERQRTYSRISRRQSSTPDIPRPAWFRPEILQAQQTFAVLLDTSGSMDRHLLAAALGCIASYSISREVGLVRVIFCDAAAYDQGFMQPEEIAGAVRVRGRGGTRLQPGITLLDQDVSFPRSAPVLIITDGACDILRVTGREHAYLLPVGARLPFRPKGPVFWLK